MTKYVEKVIKNLTKNSNFLYKIIQWFSKKNHIIFQVQKL